MAVLLPSIFEGKDQGQKDKINLRQSFAKHNAKKDFILLDFVSIQLLNDSLGLWCSYNVPPRNDKISFRSWILHNGWNKPINMLGQFIQAWNTEARYVFCCCQLQHTLKTNWSHANLWFISIVFGLKVSKSLNLEC